MSNDNYGSLSGDGSINVGVGDFRGANVRVGSSGGEPPTFTPEELHIVRHPALGGRSIQSERLSAFSIITGICSLVGLYFTLFQAFPRPQHASLGSLFLFTFGLSVSFYVISAVLKRRRFEHLLFRKYYIEAGSQGRLHLSSFTAQCPWCQSRMHLRNVGPKNGPRQDVFLCERNPRQHTIALDPTALDEINE